MTIYKPPVVILAAGFSQRMRFHKLLLAKDGKLLAEQMLYRLRSTGWGRIAVVISDRSLIEFIHREIPGVSIIINSKPDRGMISSLRLGLDWAGAGEPGVLAWPVDHPLIEVITLDKLRTAINAGKVVIPVYKDKRGHPTWWGQELWKKLYSMDADEGAREVLGLPDIEVVELSVNDESVLQNIDTIEDAERFNLGKFIQ